MGKIIAFTNNKGGVGKTTSVLAIGRAWAKMGKKILFIDLDSQANLTTMVSKTNPVDQKWDRTLEDCFTEGADSPLPIMHTEDPNIDFVPTDLDLSNFDSDTSKFRFKELILLDTLTPVKDGYDFIMIDCPPSLSVFTWNAMIASDYLVLVAMPDGQAFHGCEMTINLYNEVVTNPRYNPNLTLIGILITRMENDTLANYCLDQFQKTFPGYIISPVIRKDTKIKQASTFNFDIYASGSKRAAVDYLKAAQDIYVRIQDSENGKKIGE